MNEPEIIVAIITSLCTLIGVLWSNSAVKKAFEQKVSDQYEQLLYRITELEKKQEKHNNIVAKTYSAEKSIEILAKEVEFANQRIDNLEEQIKR